MPNVARPAVPPPGDRALLAAIATGDERAFATVFDRHVRPVRAFARSRVGDPAEADDVVQATFVLLWQKRRTLDLGGESLLPWLLGTARLVALTANRAARRRGAVVDPQLTDRPASASGDPAATAESADALRRIAAAIDGLDPVDRQLAGLCLRDGLTYAQAAEHIGTSAATVRGRLARLRRRLRAELAVLRGT